MNRFGVAEIKASGRYGNRMNAALIVKGETSLCCKYGSIIRDALAESEAGVARVRPWCWLFCDRDRDRADRGTDLGDCAIEEGALRPGVRECWEEARGG